MDEFGVWREAGVDDLFALRDGACRCMPMRYSERLQENIGWRDPTLPASKILMTSLMSVAGSFIVRQRLWLASDYGSYCVVASCLRSVIM